MKKIILFILFIFCLASTGYAEPINISLQWDECQEKEIVKGIKVYESVEDGEYQEIVNIEDNTTTNYIVLNRDRYTKYSYKAVFYNHDLIDSDYSNTVYHDVLMPNPQPPKLSIFEIIVAWFKKIFSFV